MVPGAGPWFAVTGPYGSGGNIVTGDGVVFKGARADDHQRPFNLATGKVIRSSYLPAGGQATAMPPIVQAPDGTHYGGTAQ